MALTKEKENDEQSKNNHNNDVCHDFDDIRDDLYGSRAPTV
jgi:hypothetical protein